MDPPTTQPMSFYFNDNALHLITIFKLQGDFEAAHRLLHALTGHDFCIACDTNCSFERYEDLRNQFFSPLFYSLFNF